MRSSVDGGLVLAVDGGGAKTDLALLSCTGSLLSFVRGGRSQAYYLGVEGSIAVVQELLESAIIRAGFDPADRPIASAAYVLLAGADLPEERSNIQARIEQLEWSTRLVVDNDTPALLRAGTARGSPSSARACPVKRDLRVTTLSTARDNHSSHGNE